MPKTLPKIIRWICLSIWLGVIVVCISWYIYDPSLFTAANIAAFLLRFEGAIWGVYLVMSALRGFSLLPSTPLVIAGTMLFPSQPLSVLGVCLLGIFLSSSMIYFFSEYLGFSEYFEGHKPELTHKLKAKLEHPLGFAFVAAWAFFPLVPTDLVCYLAGTIKMNYWKFIIAVLVGELILCSVYVLSGSHFFRLLLPGRT